MSLHEILEDNPNNLMSESIELLDDNNKKFTLYLNTDLKYKTQRSLDINKLINKNSHIPNIKNILKNNNNNGDKDTIEYRLKDSKKHSLLDLSHLNLDVLNLKLITKNIRFLCLSNNNLVDLPYNINLITNLEVLDLSHNKIINMPKFNSNLIELVCNNNLIKDLDISYLNNLKRLDISNNLLTNVFNSHKLNILNCSNNKITNILSSVFLIKLYSDNNKLESITNMPNLIKLDTDHNKLTNIINCDKLQELYVNNNLLVSIPNNLTNITILHIRNNNINRLPYFSNLQELVADYDKLTQMSKEYKISTSSVDKNNIMTIIFDA